MIMDYISKITFEEKETICNLMGSSHFKDLFVKIPNAFNKIKPGFRANKLTDTQILDIVIKNVNKAGMIRDDVNIWIACALKEIEEYVNELEDNGKTYAEAISLALVDSFFDDNIHLYFKLCDKEIPDEKINYIEKEINRIKKERSDINAASDKITALEQKIADLENELKTVNNSYRKFLSENEQETSEYEEIISGLKRQIEEMSEQIQNAETKKELNSDVISSEQQLLQYEDKEPETLPKQYSEEFVSLCKVTTDYYHNTWLIRIADVDYCGRLSYYYKDDSKPLLFENRNKLFYREGPNKIGCYAVWDWSAIPNISDSSKDYVTTKFNHAISPIEIIKLTECDSIESVIAILKEGYKFKTYSKKIMFSICKNKGMCEGVLCHDKDIKNENEVLSLSDSVILLPAYEYHINDVIVDDETIFYNKVCAGKPSKLYRVKNSIDIVKNIVLDNISWNNYKTRGIAKAEYRCFKELIASVSSKNIINTIASECNCNTAIAEELLEQFISQISDYINEECLEDKIIESALKSNESLMNRAKMLITEDWKSENNELISDAEAKLNEIIKEKNEAYEELKTIQSIHTKLKEETDSFSSLLAEKEKLALDVETAVENKINSAKLKVADFIANMAFVSPSMIKPAKSSEITSTVSLEVIEMPFDKSEADEHHNWREIVDTLDFELGEAGVCSEYSRSLATYLCASFIAREPLFLIGPNTDAIAEAFTISLFGSNLSVLNCGGTFTKSFLDNSEYYSKPVVMIKNIISSRWIEYLPELLTYNEPNPYCFLTHPYSEDIQVEPKSLYNYVLPLFTEFFVDSKSTNKFCGGYFSSDFKQGKIPLPEKNKRVSALSANNLIKTKINQILAIMHSINPDLKSDDDFVFGVLQYAYAILDYDFIKNVIKDNNPPISKRLKNELKCILGDIE